MRARLHERPRRHGSAAATDSGCRNGPSAVWPTSALFRFEPARPRVTRCSRSEPREQKSGGEGAAPWGLPALLVVSSVPSLRKRQPQEHALEVYRYLLANGNVQAAVLHSSGYALR